jgi:hypothetical protein
MQCLVDDPIDDFVRLLDKGHVVTKLRKKKLIGSMTRNETIELGSVSNAQLCIYDKGRELRSKKTNILKEAMFIRDCVGDDWYNSDRPITRVEIRLGRDALKCLGVDSVNDLRERERGVIDLLTSDWFRILKCPKVRGHESTASLHPIWIRVRELFFQYFTGNEVPVHWGKQESLSCDPVALEKQALGCLSKALASRFGEQDAKESSVELGSDWVDRVGDELHEKLNTCAVVSRCKTGIEFGSSVAGSGYDVELEEAVYAVSPESIERKRAEVDSWVKSLEGGK